MRFASHEENEPGQQSEPPSILHQSVSIETEGHAGAKGSSGEDSDPAADINAGQEADIESTAVALTFLNQVVAVAVAGVAVTVCSFLYLNKQHVEPASGENPVNTPATHWQIDINSATWRELAVMRGVGPALARQIVEYRNSNGPFESVENLERVPGIGPRTLQKNRERLWASLASDAPHSERPRKDSNGTAK